MPEEGYGNLGVTVPSKTDKPIAIPSAMKTLVDSIGTGRGKGKLLVAQNTGGALFKELHGDGTLAEDGTLTLVSRSASKIHNTGVTRTSSEPGSFSTAIAAPLPRVRAGNLIEVFAHGVVASSVAVSAAGQSFLWVKAGGNLTQYDLFTLNGGALGAGTGLAFVLESTGFVKTTTAKVSGGAVGSAYTALVAEGTAEGEASVELQASSASGTLTLTFGWIVSRVSGS